MHPGIGGRVPERDVEHRRGQGGADVPEGLELASAQEMRSTGVTS
jgi:hypothetical protein